MILTKALSDKQRLSYYNVIERKRAAYFARVKRLTTEALNKQIAPAIVAIENGQTPDESVSERYISQLFQTIYPLVGSEFARDSFRQAEDQKSFEFEMKTKDRADDMDSFFLRFLKNYALNECGDKIKGITETTKRLVRNTIAQAVKEGLSIPETVKLLQTTWKTVIKARAAIIARTEILSASNVAARAGAKATGLQLNKVWLSTPTGNTRDSHKAANGQRVDIDEPFTVNGYKLMQAGDSSLGAPASEIIACRCTVYFEPKN